MPEPRRQGIPKLTPALGILIPRDETRQHSALLSSFAFVPATCCVATLGAQQRIRHSLDHLRDLVGSGRAGESIRPIVRVTSQPLTHAAAKLFG